MFNQMSLSGINTKDNPCNGCTPETGRSSTCHATCEKYKKWSIKHQNKLNDKFKQDESKDIYYAGARRRNKSLTTKSINFGRGNRGNS